MLWRGNLHRPRNLRVYSHEINDNHDVTIFSEVGIVGTFLAEIE